MRPRIAILVSVGLCAVALTSAMARANDCSGALDPCINDDTLWPHAGPATFVAVGSAETVAPSNIGFGLVTTYLSRPIVLQLVSPGPKQGSQYSAVDDEVNGTFLWSYGVTSRLELDLALALTLGQGGTGLAPVTSGAGLRDTAVRDTRFGFAYTIVPHARATPRSPDGSMNDRHGAWGLTARFEVSAPTGDQSQFAGEHTGVFVPTVAGDYRRNRFFAGAELGARLRPTAALLGARIGSQLVTAMGVGFDVLPRSLLAVAVEAWALPTFVTPAEWQVSVRWSPLGQRDLSLQLGGGGGIPFGGDLPITAPRYRFTLGLRWAPE